MVGWSVVAWLWLAAPGRGLDSDLYDLSLLPLDKLLSVKRGLTRRPGVSGSELWQDESLLNVSEPLGPGALPLRGHHAPVWEEEVDHWKPPSSHHSHSHSGSKGKLSTIFQGTVTVLAFLAFGGYLLCLVLHVLKQKKAALTMTLLNEEEVARGEPGGRRRRAVEEDAYLVLRRLAEGYARYDHNCQQTSETSH